jgi:formate dehydrogenase subunit delta
MSPDKLVYMGNQIGKFFAHQGEEKAVAAIADHMTKFWTPVMRTAAVAHLDDGAAGFDPWVKSAVEKLRK